jgi:hypothetical protein
MQCFGRNEVRFYYVDVFFFHFEYQLVVGLSRREDRVLKHSKRATSGFSYALMSQLED